MTSILSPRAKANSEKTNHQFVPGVGYLNHGAALRTGAADADSCYPPPDTPSGSAHLLSPPTGASDMVFLWVAYELAWQTTSPDRGNRMAWPASYLAAAGWNYVGPAPNKAVYSSPAEGDQKKPTPPRRRSGKPGPQ